MRIRGPGSLEVGKVAPSRKDWADMPKNKIGDDVLTSPYDILSRMSRRLSTLLVVLAAITGLLTIYGQSSADASQWKGKSSGCSVQLPSSNGPKSYLTFNTCPPKRGLLVGDSVALTMGIEMASA